MMLKAVLAGTADTSPPFRDKIDRQTSLGEPGEIQGNINQRANLANLRKDVLSATFITLRTFDRHDDVIKSTASFGLVPIFMLC